MPFSMQRFYRPLVRLRTLITTGEGDSVEDGRALYAQPSSDFFPGTQWGLVNFGHYMPVPVVGESEGDYGRITNKTDWRGVAGDPPGGGFSKQVFVDGQY
jgi:hypothetical protein